MKKFIVLMAVALMATISNEVFAQTETVDSLTNPKALRDAERARQKAAQEIEESAAYAEAVKALEEKQFVLEADQVIFKRGETAYVNTNTNFVLVNQNRGTVQVAFNTHFAGPNGIGGVTVDGTVSGVKMKTDKRGNVTYSFSIMGTGISAQVFMTLVNGDNEATVSISPNFNSQTLTLRGKIISLEQSNIFKGRSW
ncbi:DUF4251 domain-containing protein [Bacteroides sp. ET71]|uniref:DUF4251 domain-containing protein n=1 Tax=Bacteroides sp. ET71 TaxID=2939421 RepID=UPI0020114745|nr:DUF4251 domain-containing protein [Bacteroides sp. ET71]MCL1616285.1 DUF4251 domain-containing protein [Bacteroides sp. ET71]